MNYELVSFQIDNPIDRIRGAEEIAITVSCTFRDGVNERVVSGVSTVKFADKLSEGLSSAIANAKDNLQLCSSLELKSKSTEPNSQLGALLKNVISERTTKKVQSANKTEWDKLYEIAGESCQTKILGLCESLGIENIDITDYVYVEALVLIEALEKLAKPLTN